MGYGMESLACLILNYNDAETTSKLINQLQSYKTVNHILIVDNCSTDDSYQVLSKFQTSKIHVLRTDRNGGYGYGNNRGFDYISREWNDELILLMNPDTLVTESCIRKMMRVLQDEKYVLAAPVQRLHKADGKIVFPWRLPSLKEEIITSSVILSKVARCDLRYPLSDLYGRELLPVDVLQGALFMGKTDFLSGAGKYDEDIFLYNEEECQAQKVKLINKQSVLLCDDYYIHDHSVSINKSIKSTVKQKKLQLESKKYYINKYFTTNIFQRFLLWLVFEIGIVESWLIPKMRKHSV